jgi:hypothetical protein
MTIVHELPKLAECGSKGYWLRHCEGYRVDTPGGPIGFVETVFFFEEEEPVAIAVRTGASDTRIVLVPLEEVEAIRPECEVVALRHVG